jgi:hypothetical protein
MTLRRLRQRARGYEGEGTGDAIFPDGLALVRSGKGIDDPSLLPDSWAATGLSRFGKSNMPPRPTDQIVSKRRRRALERSKKCL